MDVIGLRQGLSKVARWLLPNGKGLTILLIHFASAFSSQASNPSATPSKICSFNVQFLGASSLRKNDSLAKILRREGCDMVVVQEMIAPPDLRVLPASPYFGDEHMPYFPNSNQQLKPNDRTTAFFQAMYDVGFDRFEMSSEDTGPGAQNRINSTATEWWVVFYRSTKFEVARHLRNDYLSKRRAANPNWDRVPHAFSFRCLSDGQKNMTDFTLVSAHLHTGPNRANAEKRKRELAALYSWIKSSKSKDSERDYFIVGDLNIENARELLEATSDTDFHSLNTLAQFPTNTNINGPKPYDHVIFSPGDTTEVQPLRNFEVLDLLTLTQDDWFTAPSQSPVNPYVHNQFRMYYSDHNPIAFDLDCSTDDD